MREGLFVNKLQFAGSSSISISYVSVELLSATFYFFHSIVAEKQKAVKMIF